MEGEAEDFGEVADIDLVGEAFDDRCVLVRGVGVLFVVILAPVS